MRYLQAIGLTLLVGVLPSIGAPAFADDLGPFIDHAPLDAAVVEGEEVTLSAFVEDEDGVDEVYLLTRPSDNVGSGFNTQGYFCLSNCKSSATMEMSSDGEVKYSFGADALKVPGLDYYWVAIDGKGQQEKDGSDDDFYQLEVSPSALAVQENAPAESAIAEQLSEPRKMNPWLIAGGVVVGVAVVAILSDGGDDDFNSVIFE